MDGGAPVCYAMTLELRDEPGVIERYSTAHRATWPAVLDGLRNAGVIKERIFLVGHRLFMYLEARDGFNLKALELLNEDPECKKWDDLMRSLQQPAPEAQPGEWWSRMELVFDLDWF